MSTRIDDAPHGTNLVVETENGTVYIGRFDCAEDMQVVMHDVDIWEPDGDGDPAHWIRETATYGVDVKHKHARFPSQEVTRWQTLGAVEKLQ